VGWLFEGATLATPVFAPLRDLNLTFANLSTRGPINGKLLKVDEKINAYLKARSISKI